MRKSLRQLIRRQPTCANCNAKCVKSERLFSDALPDWIQESGHSAHGGNEDLAENYLNNIHNESGTQDRPDRDVIDRKPALAQDGSVRMDSSRSFDRQGQKKTGKGSFVTIFDALLKVFDFNWKCQKPFLKSTDIQKSELRLCDECAQCLSHMYDWFLRFTKLTVASKRKSYLHSLVFPTLLGTILDRDESNVADSYEDDAEEEVYAFPVSCQKNGTKRKVFRNTSLNDTASPESEEVIKRFRRDPDERYNNVVKVLPGLRAIKTSFTGDVKSLLSCKVKIPKMTPETVEANLAKIKLEEQDIDVAGKCKQELTYAADDDDTESYTLGVVDNDPDFVLQGQPHVERRKPGRPRKHPMQFDKTRIKLPKVPRTTDCHECGKKLRTSVLLKAHLRIYHQSQYDCSYCGERYSDRKELKDHLHSNHEDEKTEICGDCNKRFFTKLDLKKHSGIHVGKQTMVCNICNGIFPSETSLKAHKLSHADSEAKLPQYKCPVENCNKRYTEKQLLHSHVRYMHERRNFFVCPYSGCEKTFGTESYLNAHIISHERVGTHLCELCGKNYKHKKDLRIHEQRYHSDSKREELKPFGCHVCPKRYFRADHLRTHRVKANHYIGGQEPELPEPSNDDAPYVEEFTCVTCNKVFVNDMALKSHLLTHEEDSDEPRQYSCSECNRKYTHLKALEYHAKYMHKLKGSFACSFCPKTFGRLSSFKRHLFVHSNTQHICGDCNKSYKNKRDLMNHYRREHVLSETSYEHECGGCSKRFYRKDMLRTHIVKTGHALQKKTEYIPEEEENDDELAIYIMEEVTDIQEGDEIVEEEEDIKDERIPDEEAKEEDMLMQPMEHTIDRVPTEIVEITGEDAEGTIAHVVMVDGDGVTQDIETEVICTVGPQDGIDPELTMFNYSIQLE